MFGVADQGGTLQGLGTIPEFIWELGLGIYATVWGFRAPSPIFDPEAAQPRDGVRKALLAPETG